MKKERSAIMCCMFVEVLLGFVSLWYWLNLMSKFDGYTGDMSSLSCNDSPMGCCQIYSHCGNSTESFQNNYKTRYIDQEAYHDYSNCLSLFQIIREESEIEKEPYHYRTWFIYRFNKHSNHYCTINSACDYYKRDQINDFKSYQRNSKRGLYMFSTSLPKSEGCDQEWMIDTILTNFNRRVYHSQIAIYMYIPLIFFFLFFLAFCSTCIDSSGRFHNRDHTSYSGVTETEPKLRGSC